MTNIKVLVFPILFMLAVFVTWQFSKPLFEEGMTLKNKKIPELNSILDQEKDLQQRTEKLYEEGNVSNGIETAVIRAIPVEKEIKNIIVQLSNLSQKDGMTIDSIRVDEGENLPGQSNFGMVQDGLKTYNTLNGTLTVIGGYGKLKQFLKDINKLDRIVNVENIFVGNADDESMAVVGKYTIDFNFYWQPFISSEAVKMGLEKRE